MNNRLLEALKNFSEEAASSGNRRIASLALAGILTTGVPTTVAYAMDNEPIAIESVKEENEREYVVKDGDTLGKIAEKYYGNSGYWEQLAEYNKMDNPNELHIGQIIKIPGHLIPIIDYSEEAYVSPYPDDTTYTVKSGDTLYCIVNLLYGLKNQESVDKFATYNNLSDPNKIYAGQVLLVPCVEKLKTVVANDYTDEYNRMGWKLNHPNCQPVPWNCQPVPPCLPLPPCPPPEVMPEPGCGHVLILKP